MKVRINTQTMFNQLKVLNVVYQTSGKYFHFALTEQWSNIQIENYTKLASVTTVSFYMPYLEILRFDIKYNWIQM